MSDDDWNLMEWLGFWLGQCAQPSVPEVWLGEN